MISSIEITRFRGIREGKLEDLAPLTVLVGANGCGKSTVLDGLLIGTSRVPGEAIVRTVQRHHGVEEGPRWLFWRGDRQGSAQIMVTGQEASFRRSELTVRRVSSEGRTSKPLCVDCKSKSRIAQAVSSQHSTASFGPGHREESAGEAPLLDGVPNICLVENRGNGLQIPLHELYSDSLRAGRRDEARAIIAEVVPGVETVEILTEAAKPIVYLVFPDHAVPAALAGDGIHALVRTTLELAARSDGVVLLEEPEVHQHPGAIRQTIRAVMAAIHRGIQIILTTQSLELIDTLLAESSDEDLERLSLYRLQLDDGVLRSHRMSGSEVAFARNEIENDLR